MIFGDAYYLNHRVPWFSTTDVQEISDPRSILGADTGRRTERLLSFDKLQAWFRTAPLLDRGPRDHCLFFLLCLFYLVRGPPPAVFRFFPYLPLAPRAPTLGDLAGPTQYPEGSPHFNFISSSSPVQRTGVSTGETWFWFWSGGFGLGGSLSGGFGPRPLFFFQVSPRKPSIRPIRCTDFAGSLL